MESIKVSVRAKADESTHRTGESEAMLKSDEQVPQMRNSVRMHCEMEEFKDGEVLRSRKIVKESSGKRPSWLNSCCGLTRNLRGGHAGDSSLDETIIIETRLRVSC